MDTPVAIILAIAAGAAIHFISSIRHMPGKTHGGKAASAKYPPLIKGEKQATFSAGGWVEIPETNPCIGQGAVLYTASNEPMTIVSIFGEDRSPAQLDHDFFRWYDATDAQGGQATVKVYNRDPASEYVFRKELDAARTLVHPGIVKIIGHGRIDGRPFSVFEHMPGGALRSWLLKDGGLTGANVLSIMRQVAEALDFAHVRGMIHSYVQPGNVWLDPGPEGRAALAEFGITKAEFDVADPECVLPEVFWHYSAPVQNFDPNSIFGRSADIYCFGVMCYDLISGADPWSLQQSHFDLKRSKDGPDIRTYRKDVPESLAIRLSQTISRDPDARPRTAAEVLAGVEAEIAGLSPAQRRAAAVSVRR